MTPNTITLTMSLFFFLRQDLLFSIDCPGITLHPLGNQEKGLNGAYENITGNMELIWTFGGGLFPSWGRKSKVRKCVSKQGVKEDTGAIKANMAEYTTVDLRISDKRNNGQRVSERQILSD